MDDSGYFASIRIHIRISDHNMMFISDLFSSRKQSFSPAP